MRLKKRFQRSLVTPFLNPPPMTSMSGRSRHRRTDKRTWHVGRGPNNGRGGRTLFLFNARYDMARCLFGGGRNNTAADSDLILGSWKEGRKGRNIKAAVAETVVVFCSNPHGPGSYYYSSSRLQGPREGVRSYSVLLIPMTRCPLRSSLWTCQHLT